MDNLQLNEATHPDIAALSTNYLHLMCQILADRGITTSEWIAQAGINNDDLVNPQKFVSYRQLNDLLCNKEIIKTFPYLGLLLGQRLSLSSHGIISHLAMAGNTYLEGLQLFHRYLKTRTHLLKLHTEIQGKCLKIIFTTDTNNHHLKRFVLNSALSSSYSLLTQFTGQEKVILGLEFDEPMITNKRSIYGRFSCPISFNHPQARIFINLNILLTPTPTANPILLKTAQRQCENLLIELNTNNSMTKQVTALLKTMPEYCFNQQDLAEHLHMSARTLRRKLIEEGVKYQTLVDNTMKEKALAYLSDTHWTIEEIAELMGYSDASNFNKAFKRWLGENATAYRA